MGAFVLGILVGWLAEWLFYTFWVKGSDNDNDCSELKSELELKNRQIASLQEQLGSISNNSKTTSKSGSTTKAVTKNSSSVNSAGTVTTKNKPAKAKSAANSSTKKNQAVSKQTKTAAKKSTTSTKRKTKASGDDFTKLSGIGPSMSNTLKTLGIDTFQKLAATDDDELREMLDKSGAKMNNNKDVMDSWNEQATLAAKGEFASLKKMQEALKK